jgi:hypothetical protein
MACDTFLDREKITATCWADRNRRLQCTSAHTVAESKKHDKISFAQNGRSVHWAHAKPIFGRQVGADGCLPVVRSTRNFQRLCASPLPRGLPSLVTVGPRVSTQRALRRNGTSVHWARGTEGITVRVRSVPVVRSGCGFQESLRCIRRHFLPSFVLVCRYFEKGPASEPLGSSRWFRLDVGPDAVVGCNFRRMVAQP